MSEQLALRYDPKWTNSEAWERVLVEARRVVAQLGLKEVAFRLDTNPSLLAHAIAERNGNHLRGEWLVAIMGMGGDAALANAVVSVAGLKTVEAKPMTPEQKLGRLEAAISELPEAVRRGLLETAGLV